MAGKTWLCGVETDCRETNCEGEKGELLERDAEVDLRVESD